jgi:hypothetical protein
LQSLEDIAMQEAKGTWRVNQQMEGKVPQLILVQDNNPVQEQCRQKT